MDRSRSSSLYNCLQSLVAFPFQVRVSSSAPSSPAPSVHVLPLNVGDQDGVISEPVLRDLWWTSVTVTGFSANISMFPRQYNFTNAPHATLTRTNKRGAETFQKKALFRNQVKLDRKEIQLFLHCFFLSLNLFLSTLCRCRSNCCTWSHKRAHGRIPLHDWSAHRTDLYLTTRKNHKRQTSMPRLDMNLQLQNASSRRHTPETAWLSKSATGPYHHPVRFIPIMTHTAGTPFTYGSHQILFLHVVYSLSSSKFS
jgi:hypothetical protein